MYPTAKRQSYLVDFLLNSVLNRIFGAYCRILYGAGNKKPMSIGKSIL
jgi:hypothetical protein